MSTVIGLSFGNTTSSIAYTKEGVVEVIANPDGDRAIPSMLAYAHGDEFHGLQAKHQILRNAVNTVGYFRDYAGVPFEQIDVSLAERTAKPIKGLNGEAAFEILGEQKSVDEIIVRQFVRIHEAARDYIGHEIEGAVLALPADVPKAQRERLVALAAKADLKVVQVIGELTAALMTRIAANQTTEDKLFVVSDFGGTRSDGAVISVNSGIFTVLANHTDRTLGGRLLDDAVLNYMAHVFQEQYSVDPLTEPRAVAKLLLEAEMMRKTLSNSTSAQFGIDSVAAGYDFSGSLNRLKFEIVARGVFAKFAVFVRELLEKAKVDALLIDEVLLVGGVSWTPKVASVVASVFDESTKIIAPSMDTKAVDPDELIARGCAIQGSLIAGMAAEETAELESHLSGAHLSKTIGVEIGNQVVPILGAHTLIPTKKTMDITVEAPASQLKIVEIVPEVKTTVHKPETQAAAEVEDDESDWGGSEDEEYETHERIYKSISVLAEISLEVSKKVKITLYAVNDKLQVVAASDGQSVQGSI